MLQFPAELTDGPTPGRLHITPIHAGLGGGGLYCRVIYFRRAIRINHMTSFSCPHFDQQRDYCVRIQRICVPGRPGCVLCGNSVFAIPWEERLREKEKHREGDPTE